MPQALAGTVYPAKHAGVRAEPTPGFSLDRCQVDTPPILVQFFWQLVKQFRPKLGHILDLGAGDGRFAIDSKFNSYLGIEFDPSRIGNRTLPKMAKLRQGCAFEIEESGFDIAVGNPPYVSKDNIDPKWRERALEPIERHFSFRFNRTANIFLYFLAQALLKTHDAGLVGLIIPYEWVSRPSAKPIRDLIERNGWSVTVYHINNPGFSRVLTTASISIIDKSTNAPSWRYYRVSENFDIEPATQPSGTEQPVIAYSSRHSRFHAMRGLSPGHQKAFLLTEGQRLIHKLQPWRDVVPAVKSFRSLPKTLRSLTLATFERHFVEDGLPCWLINTNTKSSKALQDYLKNVPTEYRDTATCRSRKIWWRFQMPPTPFILYNSGFTDFGPQFVRNHIEAVAVGSIHGIYGDRKSGINGLIQYLREEDLASQVVKHSGSLIKIEVNQMNSLITQYLENFA